MAFTYYIEQVNVTDKGSTGKSPPFTSRAETPGEFFQEMQKAYGRCNSKVFIDRRSEDDTLDSIHIGWVFERRMPYHDSEETFLQHTWIVLLEEQEDGTFYPREVPQTT